MASFNIDIEKILDQNPLDPELSSTRLHLTGPKGISDFKRTVLNAACRVYKETNMPLAGTIRDSYKLQDGQATVKYVASKKPTHFTLPTSTVSTYTIGVSLTAGAALNLGATGGIMLSNGTPSFDLWNRGIAGIKTGFGAAAQGVFCAYGGKTPAQVAAGHNLAVGLSVKVPAAASPTMSAFLVFKLRSKALPEIIGSGFGVGIASPGGGLIPGCTIFANVMI